MYRAVARRGAGLAARPLNFSSSCGYLRQSDLIVESWARWGAAMLRPYGLAIWRLQFAERYCYWAPGGSHGWG